MTVFTARSEAAGSDGPPGDSRFHLVVIGSGPAGHYGAIEAAKLGKRVAIVDRMESLGGACLHTGTIPSKTLREAILYWSGFDQRSFYGKDFRLRSKIQIEDLMFRVTEVVKRHYAVISDQLQRGGVQIVDGWARFADPHTIEVDTTGTPTRISADFVLVACGTRPARREDVPFDASNVYDSDEFIQVARGEPPKSLIVVGAGVIGLEYGSMMAALGADVTMVEARTTLLEHVDAEITEALSRHLRRRGVTFRLGERLVGVIVEDAHTVTAKLDSGATLTANALLYAVGRQPNTDRLGAEAAGLDLFGRGHLKVNEWGQTNVAHIYAAGDVAGPPALAATAMEQGRLAARHMFGLPVRSRPELLPYGIYTIPEISMVGRNEEQLGREGVAYETCYAPFEEVAKAQITGDRSGFLKLIFHRETREILGVHIIGDGASELVHIGQTAMLSRATLETLSDIVFNYPSLAEAYRIAATSGLDKLRRESTGPRSRPLERPYR